MEYHQLAVHDTSGRSLAIVWAISFLKKHHMIFISIIYIEIYLNKYKRFIWYILNTIIVKLILMVCKWKLPFKYLVSHSVIPSYTNPVHILVQGVIISAECNWYPECQISIRVFEVFAHFPDPLIALSLTSSHFVLRVKWINSP